MVNTPQFIKEMLLNQIRKKNEKKYKCSLADRDLSQTLRCMGLKILVNIVEIMLGTSLDDSRIF